MRFRTLFPPPGPALRALALTACATAGAFASSYSSGPDAALPAPWEDAARTSHTLALGDQRLAYTATAGHITAANPRGGAPEASFFCVAYTLDGQDPARRPVTFFYNGGPGSSTVWLHLGSFGPKRLATGMPATSAPSPFPLVDNAECLLDRTDLVYVDAVGTGLSEAIAPHANRTFWGVDADAAVFRDFVRAWLSAQGREASPYYLFGESYGTPRTALLAALLAASGRPPAGIVLQSSILDYNSNGDTGRGATCAGFLPAYGAVGAYFRQLRPEPSDLARFPDQMRAFADGTYAPAAAAWLKAPGPLDPLLTVKLQEFTGLPTGLWEQALNLPPGTFRSHLLPGNLLGRYDARVRVPDASPWARGGDPSSSFITPSFRSAIVRYLREDLGYPDAAGYQVSSNAEAIWDFSHDGLDLPDTIPDLAAALALAPDLKVLSLNGYHDLATPFHQTERDLARLGSQPNLGVRFYNGGHMVYLDDASRPLEKADLAAFYQGGEGWRGRAGAALEAAVRPLPALAGPAPEAPAAAAPGPDPFLYDPYVPPGRRLRPAGPPTTGAALADQVRRKLESLRAMPGPGPGPGRR
jgi:carboxypeptidase C (cathepsin A)